jgi:hypothetical protein
MVMPMERVPMVMEMVLSTPPNRHARQMRFRGER